MAASPGSLTFKYWGYQQHGLVLIFCVCGGGIFGLFSNFNHLPPSHTCLLITFHPVVCSRNLNLVSVNHNIIFKAGYTGKGKKMNSTAKQIFRFSAPQFYPLVKRVESQVDALSHVP